MNKHLVIDHTLGDDIELRRAVAQSIAQRNDALRERDKDKASVEAASLRIKEVEEEQEQYASLDADIAEHRASLIATSLENGGGFPTLTTPPELVALSAKRDDAHNHASALKHVMTRLVANLKEADASLTTHQSSVAHAAKAVVAHYANTMAQELMELEQRASDMRRTLLGVTATRPSGAIPVSAQTVALDPINSLYTRNTAADIAWWDSWIVRLMNDSEARPDV